MFERWSRKIQPFVVKTSAGLTELLFMFHQEISKKTTFLKKTRGFLNKFGIEWKSFSILPKTTSLGLSKLDFRCPWNILEQKNFIVKKIKITKDVCISSKKI